MDIHRTIDLRVSASAYDESGEGRTGALSIEPLSETLWIRVGEVRQLFEQVLQGPVHVDVTDEGAFIVDSIFETGRVACVMRRGCAHLMLLANDEMTDLTFENGGAVVLQIEKELRQALNK